uniref:Uncharacterized protein n=1 Tax=Kalanchoe fedtschenkoi TaxID=63787 RepID=A0A7N0VB98_KALFE
MVSFFKYWLACFCCIRYSLVIQGHLDFCIFLQFHFYFLKKSILSHLSHGKFSEATKTRLVFES